MNNYQGGSRKGSHRITVMRYINNEYGGYEPGGVGTDCKN